jgi:hypothetical protein
LLVVQVGKAPQDISRTTKLHQSTLLDKRLFVSQDLEMEDLSDVDHVTTFLTSSRRAVLKTLFLRCKVDASYIAIHLFLREQGQNKGAAADPEL